MDYLIIIFKTFLFYLLVALIFRIMGKREVGQLGTFDLVVFILIAELVAMAIERESRVLLYTMPILVLVLLQVLIAKFSLKSVKFRNMMDGKPSVIIKKGVLNFKTMVEQRYTLDDLLLQLREKDVRSIEEVEYAILETNGKLSVFKYSNKDFDDVFPLPIIIDGKLQLDNLYSINRNKSWIMRILSEKNILLEDVFYAFNKKNELYIIRKNELQK